MINKRQIESVLSANGLKLPAADDVIRSLLISARYDTADVELAIGLLHESVSPPIEKVDGLYKVFRSNQALDSFEISNLLGIEVEIRDTYSQKPDNSGMSGFQLVVVLAVSAVFTLIGIFSYMYIYDAGLFHPDAGVFAKT